MMSTDAYQRGWDDYYDPTGSYWPPCVTTTGLGEYWRGWNDAQNADEEDDDE